MKQEVSDDPRRARVAEGRNGPAPPTGPRSWQETQSPGASAVRLSGLGGEGPACPGSSREATGSDVTPPPPTSWASISNRSRSRVPGEADSACVLHLHTHHHPWRVPSDGPGSHLWGL